MAHATARRTLALVQTKRHNHTPPMVCRSSLKSRWGYRNDEKSGFVVGCIFMCSILMLVRDITAALVIFSPLSFVDMFPFGCRELRLTNMKETPVTFPAGPSSLLEVKRRNLFRFIRPSLAVARSGCGFPHAQARALLCADMRSAWVRGVLVE